MATAETFTETRGKGTAVAIQFKPEIIELSDQIRQMTVTCLETTKPLFDAMETMRRRALENLAENYYTIKNPENWSQNPK